MLSMVLSSMCLFKYIVIMMSINVNNFCLLQTLSLHSVLLKILLVVLFTVYDAWLQANSLLNYIVSVATNTAAVDIFLILITFLLDIVSILWGEITSQSIQGMKGLRVKYKRQQLQQLSKYASIPVKWMMSLLCVRDTHRLTVKMQSQSQEELLDWRVWRFHTVTNRHIT